mgnify:CR=1 FL=1
MKFFFTFLSLITLSSSFREGFIQEYDEKVKEAYSEYLVTEHYNPDYDYGLKLVKGLIDGEIRYGFCFYSENSRDYYVRVSYNNQNYKIDATSRGDIQAVALDLKEGDTFSILVYSSRSDVVESLGKFKNIQIMSKSDFNQVEDKNLGRGKGSQLSSLKADFEFNQEWFYLTAFLILVACGVIIFVYYRRRQGLFNKEIRSQNVFNFREFISSNFDASQSQVYNEADYEVIEEGDYSKESGVENEEETYFEKHYAWARDEDETSGFDLNGYLQSKGFVTEYRILSEDEKNLIMLELMRLKDEKRITRDEYLEETAKLWKK